MIRSEYKVSRKKPLHRIFAEIPPRYDLINHIITWGLDRHWRRQAAKECLAFHPEKVIDLCCGSGDLALNIAELSANNIEVIGVDYSQPMLNIAVQKAKKLGLEKKVSFRYGDVTSLPFSDNCFDSAGISFAFRNLTYRNPLVKQFLAEILRVLRPRGRFVIVETSQPRSIFIRKLFHLYLCRAAYRAGYLLSGNKGAYKYLAESAANYYTPDELKELLLAAGFHQVCFQPLFLGVVGVCTATK